MLKVQGKKLFIGGAAQSGLNLDNIDDDDFLADDDMEENRERGPLLESGNAYAAAPSSILNQDLPFRSGYMGTGASAGAAIGGGASLLCPIGAHNHNRPDAMSYIHARQEMKKLVRSRDELIRAQVIIEEERRRSCWLVGACVVLTLVCAMLFLDQVPDRYRYRYSQSRYVGHHPRSYDEYDTSNTSSGAGSSSNLVVDQKAQQTQPQTTDPQQKQQQQQQGTSTTATTSNTTPEEPNNGILQQFQSSTTATNPNTNTATVTNANNGGYETTQTTGEATSTEAAVTPSSGTNPNTDTTATGQAAETQTTGPPNPAFVKDTTTNGVSNMALMTTEEKKTFALMQEIEEKIEKLNKLLKWNIPFKEDRDIPLYWHVPCSGSKVADEILSHCYQLVQAVDNVGLLYGHEKDEGLSIITNEDSARYVNVDMGSAEGIQRAKDLGLLNHDIVDLIKTSYLYDTAEMFKPVARYAKCFTILRDPIDRAIDVFHRLKETSDHPTVKDMTLLEYAHSSFAEENWMVRYLSNELEDELQTEHLEMAQHILGRKCLIGFTDQFEESIQRFAKYYGWDKKVGLRKVLDCEEALASAKGGDGTVQNPVHDWKEEAPEGSEVYEALKQKNAHDMELYAYAKKLFTSQAIYSTK